MHRPTTYSCFCSQCATICFKKLIQLFQKKILFNITLAALIWQLISKIGHFNWLWKSHGHLPKIKWQLLDKSMLQSGYTFVSRFQDLFWSIFSVFGLAFSECPNWGLKSFPSGNLSTVTSQNEKYQCSYAK